MTRAWGQVLLPVSIEIAAQTTSTACYRERPPQRGIEPGTADGVALLEPCQASTSTVADSTG